MILTIIVIAIYIAYSNLLNQLNKLIYKNNTSLCWIPFANIYLLGKLSVNKIVGLLLLIGILFIGFSGLIIKGNYLHNLILSIFTIIWITIFVALLITAILKYVKLTKENKEE